MSDDALVLAKSIVAFGQHRAWCPARSGKWTRGDCSCGFGDVMALAVVHIDADREARRPSQEETE